MQRREFITLVGAAAAWPISAQAQQEMRSIGFLGNGTLERVPDIILGIKDGLAEHGYVEGRNFKFEFRFAEYRPERNAALAADLLQRKVDAIIMFAYPPPELIATISKSIPIIFFAGFDPVRFGLVDSLNKPGGNATGVSVLNSELLTKRLEILRELAPTAKLIAYLGSSVTAFEKNYLQAAAPGLGLQLLFLTADSTNEFEGAFSTLSQANAGAVFIGADAMFQRNTDQLAALAVRYRMPTIYASRVSALAGGLVSYGTHYPDAYRIVGKYAARILKGEKPSELPVQQITKIQLVVNLKAAGAIGFAIPPALIARADEVIE